jgi:hypothetical protein
MSSYIVAAPFNLPDSYYTGKGGKPTKSAKNKWVEKVEHWEAGLSTELNVVKIVLWDESYINDLLIKPQNEGLRYYWFNGDEFTLDNFQESLNSTIMDLGPRYTPELDITLPISSSFDYLLRNEHAYNFMKKYYLTLRKCAENVLSTKKRACEIDDLSKEYDSFSSTVMQILNALSVSILSYYEMQNFQIDDIADHIDILDRIISDIRNHIEEKLGPVEFGRSSFISVFNEVSEQIYDGKKFILSRSQIT